MKLEGNISGGTLHVDLSDGADLADLGLWQSKQLPDLPNHLQVCVCQLAGLALSISKLQVPNPQDG